MLFRKRMLKALVGPILIMAFLAGAFTTMMVGVQQNLKRAEDSLRSALNVVVFLQSSVSDADAKQWADDLMKQDAELQSYSLVTKEQAYETASRDPELAKSLLLLKDNPLPASVVLHYSDRAWVERSEPTSTLKGATVVQEVRWDARAQELFRSLHRWRLWCIRFNAFIGMVMLAWTFSGVYRFLALRLNVSELLIHLGLGAAGGSIAIGLWESGMRTVVGAVPSTQPAWAAFLPILFAVTASIGCLGVEARDAN